MYIDRIPSTVKYDDHVSQNSYFDARSSALGEGPLV